MRRKEGYRNEKELTKEEKDAIIARYKKGDMTIAEMNSYFKLTVRTMRVLLKEYGINSARLNRYTLNESYFDKVDTERKAYWLGYLYADGYVGDEKFNNIMFGQKMSDDAVIEQFAKDIEFTGKLRQSKLNKGNFKNGQPQIIINFSSKQMAESLRRLKMLPKKSTTMSQLPPIEQSLMRHFIRGYFDGDGSIMEIHRKDYKDHIYIKYVWNIIGTVPFLKKVKELLPIKTVFHDSHTTEMKYLTTARGKSMNALYHFLYDDATFYLARKHEIFERASGYVDRRLSTENGINPQGVSARKAG